MIRFNKILVGSLLLISLANAKGYFINHDDVCEGTEDHQCTNDYNTVRNLQIALTRDTRLNVALTADGKWGESTKKAVVAFQEYYELAPADGWVGNSTKEQLDKISRQIKFPKDKQVKRVTLMEDTSTLWNFSEFKRKVERKSIIVKKSEVQSKNISLAKVNKIKSKTIKIAKKPIQKTSYKLSKKLYKKGYFINNEDLCEGTETHKCKNDFSTVRNLQIVLNRDKKINAKLTADGKWGESTKKAVIAFQKYYKLAPADGWVGKTTKETLDFFSHKIKFPKDKQQKRLAIIKDNNYATYNDFRKNVNLKKSFKVYKDKKLLAKATGRNTKLKVDISEQRIRLYVNNKVALCSPCTTGAKHKFEPNTKIYRDKHTPKGTFKITEKIADKRSTIFGKFYRNGKVVYKGDRRKYRGPKAKYKGASLTHWMRLTSSGIGLHASKYVKRYPGTNGCIRLPFKVAKTIFKKVKKGTKVSIVN